MSCREGHASSDHSFFFVYFFYHQTFMENLCFQEAVLKVCTTCVSDSFQRSDISALLVALQLAPVD